MKTLFLAMFWLCSLRAAATVELCGSNVENLDFDQAVERRLWAGRCDPTNIGLYRPDAENNSAASRVSVSAHGYPVFARVKGDDIEIYPAPINRYAPCHIPDGVVFFKLCPL